MRRSFSEQSFDKYTKNELTIIQMCIRVVELDWADRARHGVYDLMIDRADVIRRTWRTNVTNVAKTEGGSWGPGPWGDDPARALLTTRAPPRTLY